MQLSPNELKIIEILRSLNPYEKIEVIKDKDGKMDSYLVHRSQKIVLTVEKIRAKIY